MAKKMISTLALFVCFGLALGADIYVPDDHGTIQEAINNAAPGDRILVRPGTYVENIDFLGKAVTVKSTISAVLTVIDGGQTGSVATFAGGEDSKSVLEGFTITNGSGDALAGNGAGIHCSGASPTLVSNVVTGNRALNDGGGIWLGGTSNPILTNNTIIANSAAGLGGGIACTDTSGPTVMNSIVRDNSAPTDPEIHDGTGVLKVYFCDVKGGWPGGGNIDADPIFVDPAAGDFHLTFNSPCRNMGYNAAPGLPDTDFEGDPRIPPYGIPDMGADEFFTHLYHTGAVVPGEIIAIKVADYKLGSPVILGLGSGVQDPPRPTPYGDLHLMFPIQTFMLGTIPQEDGVLRFSARVPVNWSTGEQHPLQAKIVNILTNLMVLEVE